jgi:hypothetical protein
MSDPPRLLPPVLTLTSGGCSVANRLCISFCDLVLHNFPRGEFECRVLKPSEARTMIRAAREENRLWGAARDDLLDRFEEPQRRRHEEMCMLLRTQYDIPLCFEDFVFTVAGRGPCMRTSMPLQRVEVRPGHDLLVIWHPYPQDTGEPDRCPRMFDEVAFRLFTALRGAKLCGGSPTLLGRRVLRAAVQGASRH